MLLTMIDLVLLIAGIVLEIVGLVWLALSRRAAKAQVSEATAGAAGKKKKKKTALPLVLCVIAGYMVSTRLITLIFGKSEEALHVAIWPERVDLFGFSISQTVIYAWIVMACLIVLAVILRLTVVRRMKDVPTGVQNVLEAAVELMGKYTDSKVEGIGPGLSAYLLTAALFMVGCNFVELFGERAPTSDITMTFALALVTFILINYYGIKKKGVGGRIKSLAEPTPVVFPIKLISDCAIPVSMACRLFGNILGGMIVMDLLYVALGNNAIGIPSIVGLYFNVFHPLIQAFIFVTLSLTFINEAVE